MLFIKPQQWSNSNIVEIQIERIHDTEEFPFWHIIFNKAVKSIKLIWQIISHWVLWILKWEQTQVSDNDMKKHNEDISLQRQQAVAEAS